MKATDDELGCSGCLDLRRKNRCLTDMVLRQEAMLRSYQQTIGRMTKEFVKLLNTEQPKPEPEAKP
jgi:hypothetical protein